MDNVLFSALTHNPQPLHLDEEFARETEFGQRLVNSLFTLGLMIGVSVGDTTLGTTVANLGMTDCRFPKPVFHGDTLPFTTTIAENRESKYRSDAAIVLVERPETRTGGTGGDCTCRYQWIAIQEKKQ